MATVTNFANAFETTLTADMLGTDLTAQVQTTDGAPSSPCYLVIDPHNDDKREYVLFDGTFTTTSFVTTALANRYLAGSAAASGITHAAGAIVRFAPVAQHFDDLHGRIDTDVAALDAHKTDGTLGSAGPHSTQFAATEKVVNVTTYGAVGDGTTDDTAAIQAALDAGTGLRVKLDGDGTYLAYALKVHAGTTVDLGTATLKKRAAVTGDQTAEAFTGITTPSLSGYAPLLFADGDGVRVAGGRIDGNRAAETLAHAGSGSFGNMADRAGVLASTNGTPGVENISVEVEFVNMFGVAIDLDLAGDVVIEGCREDNAAHMFANITGDAVNFTTRGELVFTGNRCFGNRANVSPANPVVLDRKASLVFESNIVDETETAESGGCKVQDSTIVVVGSNTFRSTYLKPQSAATFYGDSFAIKGNVFTTHAPATHKCGMVFGSHRMKTLTVSGNSITDGHIGVERSSDAVNVVGNTIRLTRDCRVGGAHFYAIAGGSNQNGGVSGRCLVAGNIVDLNDQDGHAFLQSPGTIGDTEVRGNTVHRVDTVFSFMSSAAQVGAAVRIIGNTIKRFRSLGRINPHDLAEFVFKGNAVMEYNTAAVTNMTGSTVRALRFTGGAFAHGLIAVTDNVIHCREVAERIIALELSTSTVNTLDISNNVFNVYDDVTLGQSVGQAGGTITNLWVTNNLAVGDLSFGGTISNEFIEGNTFTTAIRKVLGTTKKHVSVNGETSTTVGAAGTASALPSAPTGYMVINVDGTNRKVPYYTA